MVEHRLPIYLITQTYERFLIIQQKKNTQKLIAILSAHILSMNIHHTNVNRKVPWYSVVEKKTHERKQQPFVFC